MDIVITDESPFGFRGKKTGELDLLGFTVLERMRKNLLGQPCARLPQVRIVLQPVFPFLTVEKLTAFCARHKGNVRFRGGLLQRSEGAFAEAEEPDKGIFTLADYAACLRRAASEAAEYHMRRGALVEEGSLVDWSSVLGEGAVVRGGSRVFASTVGANAVIEGSELSESEVGEETRVTRSVLKGARAGNRCTVGPFAYLRPGSAVADGCRIGDFVELKNAAVGRGCKISHLAYVGDAELGERVNVGCGVVFANYDGKQKHYTRVGDDCFLGSNCNLVAPVRVGAGSFLAAGTTLTRDLNEGDFCIGRSRECVKAGGAEKYRR